MVLKDIKNDPVVSAGSHPTLGSSKRRMSDSECMSSLPQQSKIRKGILQKGVDDCLTAYRSGQNIMNICSDMTNSLESGLVALQSKELKKKSYCKAESSHRRELKNSDGMVPTVTAKESIFPHEMRSFPEHNLASKQLSNSRMSMSYFADPTVYNENEEPASAEIMADNSNKFFSTPMASKKVKKKLTPVMELDIESYTSEEWRSQDNISSTAIVHKNSCVLSQESPTQTPLYRSFFAAECQEIVNQIEGIETHVKSPAKRKAQELEVSTIDAEPPPYDCTPMKSVLACEVATMMRSLENSPVMEGISLFGESLLDLERMDLQFHDLSVPECSKGQSLSNSGIEGIFYLSDGLNGSCSKKRQKTEQLAKNESVTNFTCQTEEMGPLVKVTDQFTPVILQPVNNKDTCDIEPVSDCASNKNGSINTKQNPEFHAEGITLVGTTQVMKVHHSLTDNLIEPVVLKQDDSIAANIKVIESSPNDLANTTQNIASVHEEMTADRSMQLNERNMSKLCSNSTQDIQLPHDELLPTTATDRVVQKTPIHLALDTKVMHKEFAAANTTHEIESVPQTSNITQDISSLHEEISVANTTHVTDLVPQTSANITEEVSPIHREVGTVNITQLIEVGQQHSANTTQDILPMHDEVTATNSTQVFEVGPQSSTNTTHDISSMHGEGTATNSTHVIEVELQSSPNTTHDISLMHEEVVAVNTTQVIEIGSSVNTTQDIVSIDKEIPTDGIGIMEVVPQLSASNAEVAETLREVIKADTTQDIPSVYEAVTTASTAHVTDRGPQSSINTTQDIVSTHEEIPTVPDLETLAAVPQLTASNTEVTALVDFITVNNADEICVASEASLNRTQATSSMHDEVITLNSKDSVAVQSISVGTKLETVAVDDVIKTNTSHTTDAFAKTSHNASHNVGFILDEVLIENNLFKTVPQTSTNAVLDTTEKHGVVLADLPSLGASEHHNSKEMQFAEVSEGSQTSIPSPKEVFTPNAQQSVSPSYNLVTENKEDAWELSAHKNVDGPSLLHPQENLNFNETNAPQMPESGEDNILEVDMVCGSTDNGTLVGTIAQSKPSVIEGELLNTVELKCYKSVAVLASLENEVDACKEANVLPLLSESCSMIQEEENIHDVSVFSAGSLSFVTSTPVPGFNNFLFQKPCKDSVHQDPNVSLGSVSGDSTNKVPVQQGIAIQPKSLGVSNSQNKPIPRRSMLPPYTERCIRPPSGLIPRQIPPTSGIPSARRSLALFSTTGQNSEKEPMFSKIAPRGISGRGIIRAPLARQSLPRVGPVNVKQTTEGAGTSIMANKLKGSCFRTPKAAAAKTLSTATHSQLPVAPSLVKPPSRLSAPSSGRLSVGVQNATANLQDPACEEAVNSVCPRISAEVRTGVPKQGISSIRPPQLLHSQKIYPKLKSNLPGLPVKRTLPALGTRKETSSVKCESVPARSSTKQIPPSAANVNEAAFLQGGVKSRSSSLVEHAAENQESLHIPISTLEASASLPAPTSVQTESEQCHHLETCKCCSVRFSQLMKELEDAKRA